MTFQKGQKIFGKLDTEQISWASESYANNQMSQAHHIPFNRITWKGRECGVRGSRPLPQLGSVPHVKATSFLSQADLSLGPCLCRDLTLLSQICSNS